MQCRQRVSRLFPLGLVIGPAFRRLWVTHNRRLATVPPFSPPTTCTGLVGSLHEPTLFMENIRVSPTHNTSHFLATFTRDILTSLVQT